MTPALRRPRGRRPPNPPESPGSRKRPCARGRRPDPGSPAADRDRMEARHSNPSGPNAPLAALAVLPNRGPAQEFLRALAGSRAFEVMTEWTSYPPVSKLESQVRQMRAEVVLIDVSTNLGQAAA